MLVSLLTAWGFLFLFLMSMFSMPPGHDFLAMKGGIIITHLNEIKHACNMQQEVAAAISAVVPNVIILPTYKVVYL